MEKISVRCCVDLGFKNLSSVTNSIFRFELFFPSLLAIQCVLKTLQCFFLSQFHKSLLCNFTAKIRTLSVTSKYLFVYLYLFSQFLCFSSFLNLRPYSYEIEFSK